MTSLVKRPTVLIVDDSTPLLEALTPAFEESGYAVGWAIDGEEVFRKLTALEPAAILLDVYLPNIDGADVCRLIKSHPVWRESFLLVMSGRLTPEDEAIFLELGAGNILRKPFEPKVAVELVNAGLAARSAAPPA